ncbi:hypothetical protein NDU88_006615 [Pleurodeles waltl]|uniref:Uncharacterized protein n=1 Tax=Pleurodeles waltl TaxID=8319 RepID=A0AAV7N1I3_PLEWA|nr:hypothetical protein NDU88_006615 [Pleurodeles waltl]
MRAKPRGTQADAHLQQRKMLHSAPRGQQLVSQPLLDTFPVPAAAKRPLQQLEELYTAIEEAELQLIAAIAVGDGIEGAKLKVPLARVKIIELSDKKAAEKYTARRMECYE